MKALSLFLLLVVLVSTSLGEPPVSTDNVVLLPVKNDPTVSFRIWFKVGSQDDPPGKEGLANITAAMLTDAATARNSYEQVLDKLFPLAAGYSASVSAEQTVIIGRVHHDNMKDYYPLFMDALLHPGFKQEDLDRIKSQVLNTLENTLRYSSDEELGKAVLYSTVFAGTGYGHTTDGLIGAVKSITLEDVRDFYRKHYSAGNLVIGIGGGYTEALVEQVRRDLGTLPAGAPAAAPVPSPAPVQGFHAVLVDKDAPATAISMGFPLDVLRGEKDWYPLALATSWLGEHRNSSSHLYQVIREQRGLNYGDYAYIENFPHAGSRTLPPQNAGRHRQLLELWIRPVPNETGHFALRAALREFQKLVEQGMSQSDFDLTRSFLSKYVLQFGVTTMERLGYALDDRFYGISGSHLENYRKALAAMTVGEVNAAIKRHWQYGSMQIAIVTKDAQRFRDALVEDRPSPITYKTPKPPAVLEEDKVIEKFPVKVSPENIRIMKVGDLFK